MLRASAWVNKGVIVTSVECSFAKMISQCELTPNAADVAEVDS